MQIPSSDTVGSATPDDLVITSRNRNFSAMPLAKRWWAGDAVSTAFYSALSITFPSGEMFFIKTLKQYHKKVPHKLANEIKAFIQQEAVHSREHLIFNQAVVDAGYDTTPLEGNISDVIKGITSREQIQHLVATACLEHITAIIAKEVISNPKHFEGMSDAQRKLWLWHSSEEIEHKGVAYDTWLHATKDWGRLRRWFSKSVFMMLISFSFAKNRTRGVFHLMQQDGISKRRAFYSLFKFAFVSPGLLRRTLRPWMRFFVPGFHPWKEDDRALIQLAESEYEAAIMEDMPQSVPTLDTNAQPVKKPLDGSGRFSKVA